MLSIHRKYLQCRLFSSTQYYFKSHYDILGITANATMSDIKKAYYNLSLKYHPDKTDGSEKHLDKFREITEAYEVLTNVESKRRYDKGVLYRTPTQTSKFKSKVKTVDESYQPAPPSRVYNFEVWNRQHYVETIMKKKAAKEKYEEHVKLEEAEVENKKLIYAIGCLIAILGGFLTVNHLVNIPGLDRPSKPSD